MLHPDLIVHNANIITLNERHPHATALAIDGSRLAFVSDDTTTLSLGGARTQKINARGKTIVPGFCDSHLHLLWFGTNLLRQADLIGTTTIDEMLDRLAEVTHARADAYHRVLREIRRRHP